MTSPFIVRRVSFDAAIIDLDGTLLDTLGDFVAALERLRLDLAARGFTSEPFTAALVEPDRKSTRLNSSHPRLSRMPSSA